MIAGSLVSLEELKETCFMKHLKRSLALGVLMVLSVCGFSQQPEPGKTVPPITLANSIEYADTTFSDLPGNGFLIDIGGEILAVTCKHALWLNRASEMKNIGFMGQLREWKMVVLNDPTQYVILGDLINANPGETIGERNTSKDYLVFHIRENHSNTVPLKLGCSPVSPGDTVNTVGWTYRTKKSESQIFTSIAAGYSGSGLLINALVRQNLAGLSGSPVINSEKELVAITSSWKFDPVSGNWAEAPCSIDYLWEVLYGYWLNQKMEVKGIPSFQLFLADWQSRNRSKPEISSYVYTELFFADWLSGKGYKYGSTERFDQWTSEIEQTHGFKITPDSYRSSLLIFDGWKADYFSGKKDFADLEQLLKDKNLPLPDFIDFCEYSRELSGLNRHEAAIGLLLSADEKVQHMGQLYAFLGDAYRASGNKKRAREFYLKCLQSYPEYPEATDGIRELDE